MSIGERIRQRRKALGLTQAKLAELADISLVTMQKIEYGERDGSAETHESLSRVLGVTVSYLVYGDNPADQSGNEYVILPDIFTGEDKELVHRFIGMLQLRREELNAAHNAAIEAKYDRQLQEEARQNLERANKHETRQTVQRDVEKLTGLQSEEINHQTKKRHKNSA